ncbi:hypothetical protein [Sphingobium xenophagum]|uniref:hypothetical protein n=1 Tax=Sphingobium xenophagum TaxID=121428 RepID=UPI000315897F|nr:hypothetical protein [Sphingobium xenophagum]
MRITKALIVADPWIEYLLNGTKDWEMRSSGASHRGWFGLIRKGSGAVHGVARLVDVGAPLTPEQMITNFAHHRIPESMIRSGEVAKWNTPWKLADVQRLARPVPYRHKSGAVTWVELDEAAIAGLAKQLPETGQAADLSHTSSPSRNEPSDQVKVDIRQRGSKLYIDVQWDDGEPEPASKNKAVATTPMPKAAAARPSTPAAASSPATASSSGRTIGEVVLTEGNIANNHIYLRSFFDRFPADAVGGSNKAALARRELTVDWGGGEPVQTDLDGSKKFFRARGWIGAFFKQNRAKAGDRVIIDETGPYCYRVRLG